MTLIAVLADIHGNLPALEAVMMDLERRQPDLVVNLGDHASGPLWPRETVERLAREPWLHISGNCDRQVVGSSAESLGPSDRFAFERLTENGREWLAGLPATATVQDDVLLVHGTPTSDSSYLLETVESNRARLATPDEIEQRLEGAARGLIVCGHSHIPRIVRLNDALIVNPGSVGLPAYDHDDPQPHAMQSGSPHARYAILERSAGGWTVALVAVPYDHEMAARQADDNGRPDWAHALRTGYAGA